MNVTIHRAKALRLRVLCPLEWQAAERRRTNIVSNVRTKDIQLQMPDQFAGLRSASAGGRAL